MKNYVKILNIILLAASIRISIKIFISTALFVDAHNLSLDDLYFNSIFLFADWIRLLFIIILFFIALISLFFKLKNNKFIYFILWLNLFVLIVSIFIYLGYISFINNGAFSLINLYIASIHGDIYLSDNVVLPYNIPTTTYNKLLMYLDLSRILYFFTSSCFLVKKIKDRKRHL